MNTTLSQKARVLSPNRLGIHSRKSDFGLQLVLFASSPFYVNGSTWSQNYVKRRTWVLPEIQYWNISFSSSSIPLQSLCRSCTSRIFYDASTKIHGKISARNSLLPIDLKSNTNANSKQYHNQTILQANIRNSTQKAKNGRKGEKREGERDDIKKNDRNLSISTYCLVR